MTAGLSDPFPMSKETYFRFRAIDWSRDQFAVETFDASFTTECVYQLEASDLSMRFIEKRLDTPLTKKYDTSGIAIAVNESHFTLAAETENLLAGFMTIKLEVWNRRAWITHLYVLPEYRGQGLGKRFVDKAIEFAKEKDYRGVWLETQNFNYPAIKFYKRLGFSFCRFDRSLYDPEKVPGETAIYFSLEF
jgi:ribosomal protein S18 acetylase RimI-like enzyme